MIWEKGFSASYYATYVDPATWRDTEQLEIISGSISRADSALRASADVTCRAYDPAQERWIRLYLVAKQGDTSEHVALFTGLATSPEININGNIKEYPLQCYSVLKPAEDVFLDRGYYVPAGASGADTIARLLAICPCPIETGEASPTLSQAIIAEESETHLSMVEKILTAIGWRLRILGDGTVQILPPAEDANVVFGIDQNDMIEPSISLSHDWFECPNCFRAISGTASAVAKDESPASPFSVINRGREVWAQETSADLSNDESVAEYAQRKLIEAQAQYIAVKYARRFIPDLQVGDLVRLRYPAQGIDGLYKIDAQSISLSFGARTEEEVSHGHRENS